MSLPITPRLLSSSLPAAVPDFNPAASARNQLGRLEVSNGIPKHAIYAPCICITLNGKVGSLLIPPQYYYYYFHPLAGYAILQRYNLLMMRIHY